jgi:small conductance mechanosensitive channel
MNAEWKKIYDHAFDWILSNGPKIIAATIVLFIGLWLIRVFNRWVKKEMARRNFNPTLRYFLQNLVAISLQILLFFLAMQIGGIQLTFFTAIIAGLSVAAGLALSGTLQNFVSGLLILLMKPYKVGDTISTQTQEGIVTSIQLFYTTVLTYDNKTIIVPNGQLSNNVVINFSKEGKRRIDIEMKFSYGIEYNDLKKIFNSSIEQSKNLLTDPSPRVGVSGLDSDKYAVTLNVWTNAHGYIDAKLEFQELLLSNLKKSGIKLPGV